MPWLLLGVLTTTTVAAQTPRVPKLAPPVLEGPWIRPAESAKPAQPVWGHANGLHIGLAPLPGPRGLIRVYAPHLDLPEGRVINFVAIEPTRAGARRRGLSELERSVLDGKRGKRFWSADRTDDSKPRLPTAPARGILSRDGDVEVLRVFVLVETFASGCQPYVRVTFRSDRPHEVALAAFAAKGSEPMRECVLTATMGNYARLRRLHLADRIVLSSQLWPRYEGNGFAPAVSFPVAQLTRTDRGHVLVAATPDEKDPSAAEYTPGTFRGWKYRGRVATQYWRSQDPAPGLVVRVNGRAKYWASRSPIPGGVSYENFELIAPFRSGQEFWFGVTTRPPDALEGASAAPKLKTGAPQIVVEETLDGK